MSSTEDLIPLLKKLRLSGVLQSLELRTRQAVDDDVHHGEFLYRLLSDEVDRRDSKQLESRVRRANFESVRSLEDFDFHFNPDIPKAKIIDLATCAFVERRENVLLIGRTGVGKSHIAQALGHRACRAGYGVLYASATEMLTSLRAARADDSYDRKLVRLITPELLIIDDLGLRPLTQDEPLDLYEIIRRRYEHTSTIITSNRDVEEWYPLFGNVLLASAAMDRLLHNAHTVVMDGDTYRNPPPAKRAKRGNNPDTGGPHRWMTNPIRLAALHRYPARAIPRDQPSTLPVNNRDPIGRRRHDPITRLLTLRSRNAE